MDEVLRTIEITKVRPVSNAERALSQAVQLARHRGLVVIISDLFDELPPIVRGLDHLRFKKHEVLLFHLFDPWERRLPLEGNIRFHDMETGDEVTTQAEGIRDEYQKRVNGWCETIERECLNRGIDRIELTTDQPADKALLDYLVRRAKTM